MTAKVSGDAGAGAATVLLVEDDELDGAVLEAVLRPTGARVLRVASLAAAVPRLGEADLLISDLLLPDSRPDVSLDGLRAISRALPVIVVTAWSGQLAAHLAAGGSRLRLFDKANFDPGDFRALVGRLLAGDPSDGHGNPFRRAAVLPPPAGRGRADPEGAGGR